jgi:hypothetical protein
LVLLARLVLLLVSQLAEEVGLQLPVNQAMHSQLLQAAGQQLHRGLVTPPPPSPLPAAAAAAAAAVGQ